MLLPISLLAFLSVPLACSAAQSGKAAVKGGCVVKTAGIPNLPSGQTQLNQTKDVARFIGAAIGVQNYTCNATTSKFQNVGAVAELFDITCLFNSFAEKDPGAVVLFETVQDRLFAVWSNAPPNTKTSAVANILNITGESLGNHFFVPNPVTNVGVSPEWDFRNLKRDLLTAGQPSPNAQSGPDTGEAFIVAAGEGTLAAPTGPEDINWLQVKNAGVKQNMDGKEFQGRLADVVYRTDTKCGQPPPSCTPGSPDISVDYASKYWFFGGDF